MAASAMTYPQGLFINNEYRTAASSTKLTLRNPWDDSVIAADVQVAGKEDVDLAVEEATKAFKGPWRKYTGQQRAGCLLKFADLVEKHADRLSQLESLPTGRPISFVTHFDVPHMAQVYRYYAGWADKIAGKTFSEENGTYKIIRQEPVGICAGIASWNCTFLYVAWKMAPALAAGCTFIFKSSEKSPFGALALGSLYAEAGFPPGVVQFVTGGSETGAMLASHMNIAKISFTGSVAGGRAVQDLATKSNLKRVTLELGGKSAAIIFKDAPLEVAAQGVGVGFLANSGQICVAASRVLVQEDIAEDFCQKIKAHFEVSGAAMGADPALPTTAHGPVVDKLQFDRIMSYIEKGKTSAKLLTGGSRIGERGCFVEPTIFVDPEPGSAVYEEEIFGPVLVVKTFKTEEEAIQLANGTIYGLAANVYTTDLNQALRVTSALEGGIISVNSPLHPEIQAPFGGVKQSGYGRELGEEGLKAYLETKSIHIK
ncbi:uncharacterized protein A1O9_12585 [Exophiala aquamarina CBS 119918]|uniref:aldehyde dehydrogenase (NAD(+)) n=1 Tax=Exophiala aquamarina CBS 119918 TaxID=1182545 RepID=A0A072NUZ5_9EURO|nr:uncharacterized protein A1O9_12585 [Exophiala aquamarina CBS 119918]KEF51436.1 hypothetical protein A1O9_12585 [Exophiala aquamarina CBS 119918]